MFKHIMTLQSHEDRYSRLNGSFILFADRK